jgi:plasmid stability protein
MGKMIQIRHLPDAIHKRLKIRAMEQGTSLSEYLVRELTRIAETPTLDEALQRIRERGQVAVKEDSLDALHAERSGR